MQSKSYICRAILGEFSRALVASGIDVPDEDTAKRIMSGIAVYQEQDKLLPELTSIIDADSQEDRIQKTLDLLNSLEIEVE